MTVINSIRELLSLPINGITDGAKPVLGYNYGARRYDRVRSGITFMSVICIVITTLCWIALLIFPRQLFSMFSSDANLVDVGIPSMHLYFFGFFLMSLQFSGQAAFVALGKSKQAVFFSLLRKAVIVFPLTIVLPMIGGLGVNGVFLAEPISNLLGGVACFVTMICMIWPMLRRGEAEERKRAESKA